jgi:aminopeptidase N
MNWKFYLLAAALAAAGQAPAQEARRPRLDVEHYAIQADVNPLTQSLTATAVVKFQPLEDAYSAVFELNNALNVAKVVDESGTSIPVARSPQEHSLRLNFAQGLKKGQSYALSFTYEGRLTGEEESPVYGIKFAAIRADHAYLMYPARWFPINDYTADRYTAEIKVAVPAGFRAIGSGFESMDKSSAQRIGYTFEFTNPSFPGSIAVVQGEPEVVSSQGVTTTLYFRGENKNMARVYGEETGKVMTYLTSVFGVAPQVNLALVETEAGTPNGYAAPGILFLSGKAIGRQVNSRLLVNQLSRMWWGVLTSSANRNHLWITNGMARYAEMLHIEHAQGPGALEAEVRDTYIEALTVENPPLSQSSRLEDYAPEFWAATAGKGAAAWHMLRYVIGDEQFGKLVKLLPEQFAWKPMSTDTVREAVNKITGQKMDYFFIQWIESSGAPEFKLEYTVFRTPKGFRVMGKVAQDLDTFRMPVDLKIETEGNPEEKRVEVMGTSSEFVVETFGKPKRLEVDSSNRVLRYNNSIRVAVAIRRGEQFAEVSEFGEALKEYQRALEVNRNNSLAHYRVAEVFFLQNNYQSAANEFREALNGDLEPKWTEVWSHINLGKIFDITGQRERAVNEYNQAIRTKDNTQGAQEEAAKYLKAPYERQRSSN